MRNRLTFDHRNGPNSYEIHADRPSRADIDPEYAAFCTRHGLVYQLTIRPRLL